MRDEHMIQRSGKQYVLFAGLLDEAHARGLLSITTKILQYPWDNEEGRAVVYATVGIKGSVPDSEGEVEDAMFTGIGDACATAKNAGPAEKDAPIRMAETRAKARALRDAINVGVTALEEMGGEEGGSASQPQQQQRKQKPRPTPEESGAVRGGAVGSTGELERVPEEAISNVEAAQRMTRDQKDQLNTLIKLRSEQTGNSEEDIRAAFEGNLGFGLEDLTRGEAIGIIQMLHKRAEEHEEKERAI